MNPSIHHWLSAARLRTLPLATASILCGTLLAGQQQTPRPAVLWFSLLTAIALQIFSNLANDYGDAANGADHQGRQGPIRMVAGGQISIDAMRRGLLISAGLSCLFGLLLLTASLPALAGHSTWKLFLLWPFWLLLGAICLWAAYRYTAGRKPYGYRRLGDAAVFLFFGWVGVLGSAYLQTGQWHFSALLPASALGLWCVMVLNLNNMRDINSDLAAGKQTVAATLGWPRARKYHSVLAVLAALLWLGWLFRQEGTPGALFPILLILTGSHLYYVYRSHGNEWRLDNLLPIWSLSILVWVSVLWAVFPA